MKKIIAVIGARPQFIKHAPVEITLSKEFDLVTIHTGQHYDDNMSKVFFDELGMTLPKYKLELGGGTHGLQTGNMLIEIERIIQYEEPDIVLVYGDTNSTLAGALAAAKLHVPVAHIEAGLRSFNKKMPEEINRILTDHMSTLLFVPMETASLNLEKESIPESSVLNVGDVMYDLIKLTQEKGLVSKNENFEKYYYATIHRPYNTDNEERLKEILNIFQNLDKQVIFSIHPRTSNMMRKIGEPFEKYPNIQFIKPVSYFENLNYLYNSKSIITDSGGMQKEAYWLRKKCVTIRTETEWRETLQDGWNTLVFDNLLDIKEILKQDTSQNYIKDLYGDGKASLKIVKYIKNYL